jgi:uncharacterized protein (AIM24 family)
MVYKTAGVEWKSRASGQSLGEKIFGVLKRKLTGESLFFTYFRTMAEAGEVGFAGSYPRRIQAIKLEPGRSFLAQRDAFLAAESSVGFDVALVKRIGAGLFGGEGLFLATLQGLGKAIIQTMTLAKLRRELGVLRGGGEEHHGLPRLGSILGTED